MEYTVVENSELTASQSLIHKALQFDEIAFQAEFNVKEMTMIAAFTSTDVQNIRNVTLDAARKRREADAYIKAAQVSERQLLEHREAFLRRLIFVQEHSHVTHTAELKVKESLGEPTASYDSILDALDRGHALAYQMVEEITARLTATSNAH